MIRTKKYITGDYLEIEVFNVSPKKKVITRAHRQKESSPAQKKLNEKNRIRYFIRLINSNFGKGDFTCELTYDDENLPDSREAILKDIRNYIKRMKRSCPDPKKVKYVYVISNNKGDGSAERARGHVHMFISGVPRDVIEDKWGKGYVNTDKLQMNEYGAAGKAAYMARQSNSERSWGSSQNLKKPEPIVSDKMLSHAQVEEMRRSPDDSHYFEKIINKSNKTRYVFTDCLVEYDGRDIYSTIDDGQGNGFSLLIRMRKEKPDTIKRNKRL